MRAKSDSLARLIAIGFVWAQKRLGSSTDVHLREDLAQEVFARAAAMRPDVVIRHPRALLATIARNFAIDSARQLRIRGGPALALDDLPESVQPWTSPDQETALLLKQIVLGLPPLYRDVFILNRFLGLTYVEIARRLDVSVKTIEYRMSQALVLCKAALRD